MCSPRWRRIWRHGGLSTDTATASATTELIGLIGKLDGVTPLVINLIFANCPPLQNTPLCQSHNAQEMF